MLSSLVVVEVPTTTLPLTASASPERAGEDSEVPHWPAREGVREGVAREVTGWVRKADHDLAGRCRGARIRFRRGFPNPASDPPAMCRRTRGPVRRFPLLDLLQWWRCLRPHSRSLQQRCCKRRPRCRDRPSAPLGARMQRRERGCGVPRFSRFSDNNAVAADRGCSICTSRRGCPNRSWVRGVTYKQRRGSQPQIRY